MTIGSIGAPVLPGVQTLLDSRRQLDDLQRQLSTGLKSSTYAGLGIDRGLTVSLNAQVSAITGFDGTINVIQTRLDIVQTSLGRIADIGREIKNASASVTFDPDTAGNTTLQKTAQSDLGELLGLLNTQVGDEYVFSGRDSDKAAVVSVEQVLDGDGVRAGLRQLISERLQADQGASGLGRIVLSAPTATSVQIAEDAVSPFGFKLAGISANLTGATVTAPAGSPKVGSIDIGATNPNPGETVTVSFSLPDGTSKAITLTATGSLTPGPNEFFIGATSAATATNFQAALSAALGKEAKTSLAAASAMTATASFFNADINNPPQRVNGPPFNSATSLVAGTTANTVVWYTGDNGPGTARSTAAARVDSALAVSYGTRASEQGIQWIVQNVAVVAAVAFLPSDPDAEARSAELKNRVLPNLDVPSGTQKVSNIQADLAATQNSLKGAFDRHRQLSATLKDFLQQVQGISNEEVGAKILTLQTRLQASLQTTALLYQTSLVNYLR